MKQFLIAIFAVAFIASADAAAIVSAGGGLFSVGATWVGGVAPDPTASGDGQSWTISSGHEVTYDVDNSGQANGWAASTVTGTLLITNQAAQVYLKQNGAISGTGNWYIGTPSQAVTNMPLTQYPAVVVHFKAGQCTMSGSGNIAWYGSTNNDFFDWITNSAAVGSSTLEFASSPTALATNDVVYVANNSLAARIGTIHIVSNITANVVSLFADSSNASFQTMTNYLWGSATSTTISSQARTNMAVVCKLNRPIVCMQPTSLSLNVFSASDSNYMQGVQFVNLGLGASRRDGYTFVDCVGIGPNVNTHGSVYETASYGKLTNCISCFSTMAYFCTNSVMVGCKALGGSYGGLAHFGFGNTFENCFATGCMMAYYGNGSTHNNSTAWFGQVQSYGVGIVMSNCVGHGSSSGIAYYIPNAYLIDCSVTNGIGGIAYMCNATLVNCRHTNPVDSGSIAQWPSESEFWLSSYTPGTIVYDRTAHAPFDVSVINGTNWLSQGGASCLTNFAQSFSQNIIAHIPAITNQAVPYRIPISIRPASTKNAVLHLYLTNSGSFGYQVTREKELPSSFYTAIGNAGWTNIPIALTNSLLMPSTKWLWVFSFSTNALHAQYSWVTLDDKQSVIMP